jgi:hypothetical protein
MNAVLADKGEDADEEHEESKKNQPWKTKSTS